jgi:hypothetical protein
MNIPGYIASHDFPGLATWKASSSGGNELFVDTPEQRELCYLYIVGRIGHTKVKLQPHGNYYDKDTENTSTLSKARLQFNLERPEDDHDFKCDFILAIHRIEELQNAAARDLGTDRRFLVLNDNGSKCLRLSSEIFVAPKV